MSSSRPLILTLPSAAPSPSVDWQPVRNCLRALRAVQEEFEQFVGSLFDEIDEAWADLETNQGRLEKASRELAETQADLAGLEENLQSDRQQRDESLQQRVVELEKERLVLLGELDAVRERSEELKQRLAEHQRRIAVERSDWQSELRLLREVLDRHTRSPLGQLEMDGAPTDEKFASDPGLRGARERRAAAAADNKNVAATALAAEPPQSLPAASTNSGDPVVGSILSQIELLQREVPRQREVRGKSRA